jgi:hypothetical protein
MRLSYVCALFFWILTLSTQSSSASEPTINSALPGWVSRSDDEIFVMAITLGGHSLSEGIITYFDGTEIFLPLEALARALEFPISVNPTTGTAQGWYFNDDQKFSLDMGKGVVNLAGRTHIYDQSKLERHETDIYVAASEIEEWFPIQLEPQFQIMEIKIQSNELLPFEERVAREKRKSRLSKNKQDPETPPYIEPPNDFFEWPFIDVNMYAGSRKSYSGEYSQITQTATLAGIIGNLDAEAALVTREDSDYPDIRMRFGRQSLNGNLLGPLHAREYAFGDVATPSLPLISDNVTGRGVMVSSFDLDELDETNQITLRGNLPVGWEVEIYRNQELIGFQTDQDVGNGRYEFRDIPTVIGVNSFRLVFFGPQGQKREKVERYYVTPDFSRPGKTSFRLAVNQADRDLISIEAQEYPSVDVGEERFIFQVEHGLTEITSLRGGLVSLSLDGERHKYFSGGLRSSLSGSLVNLDLGIDKKKGFALGTSLQAKVDTWSITAEQRWFQNFVSEKSEDLAINGEEISSQSVLRVIGRLPELGFLDRQPVSANITHRIGENGGWQTDLFGRISYSMSPFNLALTTTNVIGKDREFDSSLGIIGSVSGDIRWRGEINIDPFETEFFNSSSIFADWNFTEKSGASIGVRYSNGEEDVASLTTGLYHKFKNFNLGININSDTQRNYGASLSLSFSLGHNPLDQSVEMRSDQFARNSAINAEVFLDKNSDGVFNAGDKPIENVRFSGGAIPNTVKTTENGTAFYPGIEPYKRIKISLATETLEDPSWHPLEPTKYLTLRPGFTTKLSFPVIETGEIDGWVLFDGKEGTPAAGIKIFVLDGKGAKVAETTSSFDGYYFIENIPFGDFRIALDSLQLTSLGYYSSTSRLITIDENEPFILDQNLNIKSDMSVVDGPYY